MYWHVMMVNMCGPIRHTNIGIFLSSHQALPWQGNLEQIIHIFGYLKINPKLTLYFDLVLAKIRPSMLTGDEPLVFREQYQDSKEEFPPRGHEAIE